MADTHPPGDHLPGGTPDSPAPPHDRLRHLGNVSRQAAYKPGYSSLVRRLRIAVPLAGVIVLGIVGLWPRIVAEFNKPSTITQDDRRARMVNTRYVGADSHGRPFTITADATEQAPGGGPIDMVNPIAELTLANGRWVAVKAEHGHYDQAAGWIDLTGHVELFHDGGYRFLTERAHVEFQKNLVWGDRAVEGHGPKGEIVARGFRVADNGDNIVFTGPARLLIRPKAAQMPDPEAKRPKAIAETPASTGSTDPASTDNTAPLVVTASQDIEWLQPDRTYVAHGNVVAKRGAVTLAGDTMTAYYRNPGHPNPTAPPAATPAPADTASAAGGDIEIWRVVAEGNVHLESDGRAAFGDRMDYDADKRVVLLTGKSLKATTPVDTITARDSLEYWQDQNLGVARGNAVVTKKDQSLAADTVMAHFSKDAAGQSALQSVEASGHVAITTPTDVIRGDQGTYDMATKHAVVTGNVVAVRGKSQLEGDSADFDQAGGVSRIFPAKGKRAHGLFVPENDKPPKPGETSGGPLDVTADRDLEWLQQDHAYVARGNVIATRGTVTLTGDSLIGYYRQKVEQGSSRSQTGQPNGAGQVSVAGQAGLDSGNTEIWRVVAKGNVHIASEGRNAYGSQMDYDADAHTVVLTGDGLRATTPADTVTARDSLEYWQDLDLGVARGKAVVTQIGGKSPSDKPVDGKPVVSKSVGGDAVAAHFAKDAKGESTLDTMRASQNVTVVTSGDIVHGDQGTYDAAAQRSVVTGNVKVTRGLCQLDGESADVNQVTGISQVFQAPGKRVRGLYVSKKCQVAGPSAQAAAGGS